MRFFYVGGNKEILPLSLPVSTQLQTILSGVISGSVVKNDSLLQAKNAQQSCR